MTGQQLLVELCAGRAPARPPYIPVLGRVACALAQVDEEAFIGHAQTQAAALAETAAALRVDAVTVGMRTDPAIGVSVVERIRPMLGGRGIVACLEEPSVAAARAYGEAAVDMIFLVEADLSEPSKLRAFANVCSFYQIPVILAAADPADGAHRAEELRLQGAIVPSPRPDDPGLVGGGLSTASLEGAIPDPPRLERFFWSFPGEIDDQESPEALARLGSVLSH